MLKMAAQVQSDQLRPSLITQLDVSMSDIYASFSVLYGKEKENFVTARLQVFPSVFVSAWFEVTDHNRRKPIFRHYQIYLLANMSLEV